MLLDWPGEDMVQRGGDEDGIYAGRDEAWLTCPTPSRSLSRFRDLAPPASNGQEPQPGCFRLPNRTFPTPWHCFLHCNRDYRGCLGGWSPLRVVSSCGLSLS
jgi:hypothetical protein